MPLLDKSFCYDETERRAPLLDKPFCYGETERHASLLDKPFCYGEIEGLAGEGKKKEEASSLNFEFNRRAMPQSVFMRFSMRDLFLMIFWFLRGFEMDFFIKKNSTKSKKIKNIGDIKILVTRKNFL